MANVEFEDNTIEVIGAIEQSINIALEECAGALESRVKRNTRVAKKQGGDTKNSWTHYVDEKRHIAYVGNPKQNAIWEEYGTGEYAVTDDGVPSGKGRKGGWAYQDEEGKWHFTYGKKPSRALHKAVTSTKRKIIKRLQSALKG